MIMDMRRLCGSQRRVAIPAGESLSGNTVTHTTNECIFRGHIEPLDVEVGQVALSVLPLLALGKWRCVVESPEVCAHSASDQEVYRRYPRLATRKDLNVLHSPKQLQRRVLVSVCHQVRSGRDVFVTSAAHLSLETDHEDGIAGVWNIRVVLVVVQDAVMHGLVIVHAQNNQGVV